MVRCQPLKGPSPCVCTCTCQYLADHDVLTRDQRTQQPSQINLKETEEQLTQATVDILVFKGKNMIV